MRNLVYSDPSFHFDNNWLEEFDFFSCNIRKQQIG